MKGADHRVSAHKALHPERVPELVQAGPRLSLERGWMEYNEIAAKKRKQLKSYAFMRLLRLFAAILFPYSAAYAPAPSVTTKSPARPSRKPAADAGC